MLSEVIMFKSIVFIAILSCLISSTTSQFKPRQPKSEYIRPDDSSNIFKLTKLYDLLFNVVKDERTNELYVGGRNHIYKLDSDELKILQNTTTGPAEHHSDCKPHPETCHRNRTMLDNDNKLLLVYMDKRHYSKVLSCGTIHQGMCLLHQKSNLDHKRFFGSPTVVNNFVVSSTNAVGFLANVPYENDSVVFVGNQYDGRNLTLAPPFIASKKITVKSGVGFEHTHEDRDRRTEVDIDPARKPGYPVTFILGFSDELYAYFITTSPVAYGSSDLETRISRVCLKDKSFKSFSEIPIVCEDNDTNYNIATSAYIGSRASSQNKDVLYVSLMHGLSKRGPVVDQKIGSVICSFTMSEISTKFYEAAKECSVGSDLAKLSTLYIGSRTSSKCSEDSLFNQESLCHPSNVNYYIEGNNPVTTSPLIKLPSVKITSLSTTTSLPGSDAAAVIAIVGTSSGEILKVLLESKKSRQLSEDKRILYRTSLSESVPTPKKNDHSEVRPSTAFDANMDNLFLLSGSSILKFPVKSCGIYTTCKACLSTNDPLECGWCDGKCGHAKECPISSPPDRSTCTPVIYDFKPRKGTTHGGTPITIYGDNFGSRAAGEHTVRTSVLIGTDICEVDSWEMTKVICRTKKSTSAMEAKLRLDVTDTTKTSAGFDIRGSVTSIDNFEFVDPIITSITPKFGPQSGGTNVTILGQNLDAGATRKILVGSSTCEENVNNGKNLSCITGGIGKKSDIGVTRVQVHFDGFSIYSPENFTYKANPELTRIHPTSTIAAGGVTIYIEGKNLDSLSNPVMAIQIHDNPPKTSACTVVNSTVMTCTAPSVWKNLKPTGRDPLITDVKISMDNKVISDNDFKLKYYPDPAIYAFEGVESIYLQEPVIKVIGTNLRPDFEVEITAGTDKIPCLLLEDSSEVGTIKCRLLLKEEPNLGDALEVFYSLGQMKGSLGTVEFVKKPQPSIKNFVIVTIVFLVLLVLVVLIFVYLKKQGLIMKKEKHPSFSVEYRSDGRPMNENG